LNDQIGEQEKEREQGECADDQRAPD